MVFVIITIVPDLGACYIESYARRAVVKSRYLHQPPAPFTLYLLTFARMILAFIYFRVPYTIPDTCTNLQQPLTTDYSLLTTSSAILPFTFYPLTFLSIVLFCSTARLLHSANVTFASIDHFVMAVHSPHTVHHYFAPPQDCYIRRLYCLGSGG